MTEQVEILKKEIENLKQKYYNLYELINNLEDLIIHLDYNGRYLSVVPTSPKYLLLPVQELIGKNINDLFDEKLAIEILNVIQKAIESNSTQEIQYPLIINNKQKYFKAIIKPNNNKQAIAIIKDISLQEKSRRELQKNIEKNETILNSIFEGIIIHQNGNVSFVNEPFLKITGYNRDELIGNSISNKIPLEKEIQNILPQIKNQSSEQYYVTAQKKNGEYFIAEVEGKNLIDKDNTLRITAIRDVTERIKIKNELKRSQERLKTIYDFVPISIWEEDFSLVYNYITKLKKKGVTNFSEYFDNNPQEIRKCAKFVKIIDCNETTLKIYQAPDKKLFYKNLDDILTNESYSNFKKQLIAISEGQHYLEAVIKNKTLLGKTITVSLRWNVVPKYHDNYKRVLVTIIDITKDEKVKIAKEILYNISNAFAQSNNLNTLSTHVKTHLGKLFNTDNFYIALLNKTSDTFQMIYQEDKFDKIDSFPANKTLTKYLIDQNKPMIVKEKEQIRLINKGIIGNFGETSKIWMGTPLYDNQEIIGAMVVQSYQDSEAYTEDDLEILQFIAEKISSLIIQKKAQDELKVVQHRLETATSMLRHDIANGLSVIKSALKLYRHTNQPNFLDEIDKRIKKSLSLIDSHREQERFIDAHPNLNEYKIKDVIKKIIPSYPNIQFNIDGDIIIYADDAIYSVFENLIFNSVKYRKADTIKISFTHSTGKCEILYSDNGLKIDKTTENNFSENNVFEKNIGKTGIGLYLVKRIIESYSGGIYYIRKGEAGANFIIRINCPLHNTINH